MKVPLTISLPTTIDREMTTMTTSVGELSRSAGKRFVELVGDAGTTVTGAQYDSRNVTTGDLFFCVPGATTDGHLFAATAVEAGAAALCVERVLGSGVPEIVVDDVRAVMPSLSAQVFGHPANELTLLGVTGTNGKTTTAFLIDSILRADGRGTGLIGTIETRIGDERKPGVRTTPESVDVQRLLRQMLDRGVSSVVMEVTSHALVYGRVDGIHYASALFTNLTQDHLDLHQDMEAYFEAKSSLFTPERASACAINIDDPYGQRLAERVSLPVLTFGVAGDAMVRPRDVELGPSGSTFEVVTPQGETAIETSLVGPFNVSNCLAAIASCLQAGIDLEPIARGIKALSSVPGRFESIDAGQSFTVVVDYAHTPDSLDNVLRAARRLAAANGGKVICVFGCGGDRDRAKRPLMGIAVARHADIVVVTSDNPRSEDPEAIIGQILEGVAAERPTGADGVNVDRRAAIASALAAAGDRDVVVVAGKGHETGQEFADRTIPFDDREVVREELAALGHTRDAS